MTTTHTRTITLPPMIGLSGYARAGKDTAANALTARGWFERAKFATGLYRAVHILDPVIAGSGDRRVSDIVDEIGWEAAKDTYPDVRRLLQRMGTDVGRVLFGADFWVTQAMRDLPDGRRAVFTDCRFPNEAQAIIDRGGVIVRVDRPGVGPAQRPDGTVHESETALDGWPFDLRIRNDGTERDLHRAVLDGLRELGEQRAAA